ncbi:MAG: VOC family protein [Paracoccaceae bacterium]|nr:VOC family protein [Paracoccaceae bacterium]MDG2257070.1 VOC family protein [Paracoccaceae bacterium]
MEQRLSGVVLGVDDLERAKAFYTALGWEPASKEDGIVAFNILGAMTVSLYPWKGVAEEFGLTLDEFTKTSAMLAHNVRSRDDVDSTLAQAKAAGANIIKPAVEVFWGGYSGYFQDLDGHYWEVAHNPFSPLGPLGGFQWNGGEGAL